MDSSDSAGHFKFRALRGVYRLTLKELKEILRDRRTILTLVGMPLLIYPLLSILFQKFYFSATQERQSLYRFVLSEDWQDEDGNDIRPPVGVDGRPEDLAAEFTTIYVNLGEAYLFEEVVFPDRFPVRPLLKSELDPQFVMQGELKYFSNNSIRVRAADEPSLEELVQKGEEDVGIRLIRIPNRPTRCELVQCSSGLSALAGSYVRKRIEATNEVLLKSDLIGVKSALEKSLTAQNASDQRIAEIMGRMNSEHGIQTLSLDPEGGRPAISMATLVPLILVLMTVTGAVYPAIDLTAGERERGTLEALIAAPIPRFQVLFAKFVGVLTVAMLTAVVNMTGMFSTLAVFGLLPIIFGEHVFDLAVFAQIFGLLILFAGFFSAVLLAVTSFARSFKEAQAYIIPLMLLSITPGVVSLTPSLSLSGVFTIVPLMNIVLLARDIMEGSADVLSALIAICSTIFYGIAALSLAAKIFGSDAILYGSQTNWRSLFKRPSAIESQITVSRSMACLAVLFPLSFLSIGLVSRVPQWYAGFQEIEPASVGYVASLIPFVLSTVLVFMVVPGLFLWHGRISFIESIRIKIGRPSAYLAAILLGVCLWPLIGQFVSLVNNWLVDGGEDPTWKLELLKKANEVVAQWRTVNPVIILFCFSIVPAICEEFFFRGILFRSLLWQSRPWLAILISALTFGVFHTLSLTDLSTQKLLPSFIAGIVLALVCYKSGSIIPGILLHSINNGILVSVAYYEPELIADGWITADQEGFPTQVLIGALIGTGLGLYLIGRLKETRLGKLPPSE